jgi:hypothetical protein
MRLAGGLAQSLDPLSVLHDPAGKGSTLPVQCYVFTYRFYTRASRCGELCPVRVHVEHGLLFPEEGIEPSTYRLLDDRSTK